MRKRIVSLFVLVILTISVVSPLFAAFASWSDMADEMGSVIDSAYGIYAGGDKNGAKAKVDEAYYGYYEKFGFEKTVMAYISGARASLVEYQFSLVKKAMTNGAPKEEVRKELTALINYIREDAYKLDGKTESPWGVFFGSLVIIVREGFEAIIIVGAIIAYLLKSGNKKSVKPVYWGSIIALAFSVLMAWIFNLLTDTGENQELIEGITMLVAVCVLFYVSNWMVSKAEAAAWTRYIENQVQASVEKGSQFSLAFAAFLAVFREGAETILFYQALIAQTQANLNMVWLGLGIGIVMLVIIYILIRVLSMRLPLKPFFLGTSILLFMMSVTLLGNGVKELQEGNLVGVSPVEGIASIDILGIYPTLETLIPQIVLLAITIAAFVFQLRRGKSKAKLITNS
jgi:high-affinity iron transporter